MASIELPEITDANRDAVASIHAATSHVIGEGGPEGFYERLGFIPTGTFDPEGERILRLDLAPGD